MAEIVWSNPALEQLDDLAQYIAVDKPDAARALVRKVVEAVGRLAEFPLSGRVPDELPNSVYREVVVPPCRVFYRVSDTTVFIIHVMREERALRAHMLERASFDVTDECWSAHAASLSAGIAALNTGLPKLPVACG